MPPKSKTNNHDDAKSETPNVKERNGNASNNAHGSNGSKLRRVASSAGTNLRDVTTAGNTQATTAAAATTAPPPPPAPAPGIQWSSFDRDALHDYRHEYRLDTPTAFADSYHQWVLSRPGGIGLRSPTMARKTEYKRQTKEKLAQVCRKHFNGVGIQENDAVIAFLHKVRHPGIVKTRRDPRKPHSSPMP